ncbi:MAG: hypothetical protein RL553_1033 [Planctomycetota bacterium]|jgi:hypothetical protein
MILSSHRLNLFPVLALGLMAVAFGVVGHTRQAQAQNGKDDLQGKWNVIVANQGYKDLLSKTEAPTIQIHERRVTLALASTSITGPFQVDVTKKPNQFEMALFSFQPNTNVWRGTYKTENGLLHLYAEPKAVIAEEVARRFDPFDFNSTIGVTLILKPEGAPLTLTQERYLRERQEKLDEINRTLITLNHLKQIALAMHNYNSVFGAFPTAAICDKKTGKPLLSWRVAILPFIEQEALYKQFKMDEPWDSEHNLKLAKNMPKGYFNPKANKPGDNKTHYRIFYGKGAAFELNKTSSIATFTDGTSNTLTVVEAEESVVWTNPNDFAFDPTKALPKMLSIDGKFSVAFCDGSVRTFKMPIDQEILKLLIQKNDGKPIPQVP